MRPARFLLAATLCAVAACDATPFSPLPDDAVVRWGRTCGSIAGYCGEAMEITRVRARLVRTAAVPDALPALVEEHDITAATWSALRSAVERSGIWRLHDDYGPPLPDVGREWAEVAVSGSTKRVTFAPGQPPRELRALVDSLHGIPGPVLHPGKR